MFSKDKMSRDVSLSGNGFRISVIGEEINGPTIEGGTIIETEEEATTTVITTTPGSTLVEVLEQVYEERRSEIITPELMIVTPLMVLKEMAGEFMVGTEIKTFEIHVPQKLPGPNTIIQRVTIKVGDVEGNGESPRYRLSLQLAAADLLERIKAMGTTVRTYGMLPGSRLNPWVYRDLRELCQIEELASMPTFERITPESIGSDKLFAWKCYVGRAATAGASDSIFLAKRMSAKAMFEQLTGQDYPDDRIATGMGCIQEKDFLQMGIVPVKTAKLPPPRPRASSCGGITPARSDKLEDEIFEDEFAEEEDDVTVAQNHLTNIRI